MSYVAKLQNEITLVPGESPHDFMMRYLKLSSVAPGITLQEWTANVMKAAQETGHPTTPLIVECAQTFAYLVNNAATHTINHRRAPNAESAAALSDTHIYLSVCMSSLQRCLDQLRADVPDFVPNMPDLDPERTATLMMSDLNAAIHRFDELNSQRQAQR